MGKMGLNWFISAQICPKGSKGVRIRDGLAVSEYAVHADYAHMRKYADADADENLIHINHI